ncbi:MAG: GNAT family N-acetyltransferase [Muribaculaceae bacterium]|nr:GNAT family N-acetyltransferase [Muribaculaceae bacterium]MDE6321570.1 GNAT family N-acetyltransferase [Muribaculaceae bacterium]
MRIERYTSAWRDSWDELVDRSTQGTFLFKRDYMEYHAQRFTDFSLLAFDDKERLVAVLPASVNMPDNTLVSHGGLTYGGWITDPKRVNANVMLEFFELSLSYIRAQGIMRLIYRPVPTIYHRYPAQDDLYALFRCGAKINAVNISSTVDLKHPLPFDNNARRCAKYATAAGVTVDDSRTLAEYWPVLSGMLKEKYNTTPVHSIEEIELLMHRFPENIKLHCAIDSSGTVVAGVLVYLTDTVAHCQYIAASCKGKELKVLPLLFQHLIQVYTPLVDYLDFGTSNEDGGLYLNAGLLRQKAGMGGRGIAYTSWEIIL